MADHIRKRSEIPRGSAPGLFIGIKVGSRGDWRFVEEELLKLKTIPKVTNEQKKVLKIKKLLIDNAEAIQKLATINHAKLIGSDPLRHKKLKKYSNTHIKIVKAIAK